jgi:hypothetical protein
MIQPPRAVEGPLILADIGGYTSFLTAVSTAHADDAFADGKVPDAFAVVSSLLDGIVGSMIPPFTLAKLEGDAVFAYAEGFAAVPHGRAMLDGIAACHAEFRRRLGAAHDVWTCSCDACLRLDGLELKFILHAGRFVLQVMAGTPELVGSEVVMAHRLLKTEAAERAGTGAYALVTDAAARALGIPTAEAIPLAVEVEHYAALATHVFALGPGPGPGRGPEGIADPTD